MPCHSRFLYQPIVLSHLPVNHDQTGQKMRAKVRQKIIEPDYNAGQIGLCELPTIIPQSIQSMIFIKDTCYTWC